MNLTSFCLILTLLTATAASIANAEENTTEAGTYTSLAPELEKFRPFINRTYRGEYRDEKSGKVSIDISQWQRALNGQAIRVIHSLDQGRYGGETLFFFDKNQSSVRFYYFTTAGFYTEGSVSFEGDTLVSTEAVNGEASGITSVVSKAQLNHKGVMTVDSTYLKGEVTVNTSHAVYTPIAHQDPQFK